MDTWQTAACVAGVGGLIYIGAWIRNFVKWRRANQKTQASEPIDATDWLLYDSTCNINVHRKQTRRELYEDMKGKEGTK
jgi:hypothetical protein